jgi:hypothetical protein
MMVNVGERSRNLLLSRECKELMLHRILNYLPTRGKFSNLVKALD